MHRREREELRRLERVAIADDPTLDRVLRAGLPSAVRRRWAWRLIVAGVVLFGLSILARYSFGALVALTMASSGAYIRVRADGPAPDLLALWAPTPWPRA